MTPGRDAAREHTRESARMALSVMERLERDSYESRPGGELDCDPSRDVGGAAGTL